MSEAVERVLARLQRKRKTQNGWTARCPAHDDRRPSLSIREGDDGRVLMHCHAGCNFDDIVCSLGLSPSDLMTGDFTTPPPGVPATKGAGSDKPAQQAIRRVYKTAADALAALEHRHGPSAAQWPYHDASGCPVGLIVRWNTPSGKTIRPLSKAPGGWTLGAMSVPRPLYRLPDLIARAGERVYVAEGEKCCDALADLGLLATTSAHGSRSAGKTDWRPLAGREVVIVPDADEAGKKYASEVAYMLAPLTPAASVRIVDIGPAGMGLAEKTDVYDWIEQNRNAGHGDTAIRCRLESLAASAPIQPLRSTGPALVCMADVQPREVNWLWPGRVPLRRITLLVGRPGEGKSFLTCAMAAHVTTGRPWPDGSECPKGSVILITAEDDPSDTIRPRLNAHQADARRVHHMCTVRRLRRDGRIDEVLFTLGDVAELETALQSVSDCLLIIIDPVGSFMGHDTDAHRDNEVRGILAPVALLAEKYGPAVVVVAHRRKSPGDTADDLALGSRAFTGIARAVWHLTRDSSNKSRRLLLPGKNNLAREGHGLAFSIEGHPPAIVWEQGPVLMSADDALVQENSRGGGNAKPGPKPKARDEAAKWLAQLLSNGAVEAKEVKSEANAAGLAWRTVQRAADQLGVIREKCDFNGGWTWRLPEDADGSCHDSSETDDLASWPLGDAAGKNGECESPTAEHAKSPTLGEREPSDNDRPAVASPLDDSDGGVVEMLI